MALRPADATLGNDVIFLHPAYALAIPQQGVFMKRLVAIVVFTASASLFAQSPGIRSIGFRVSSRTGVASNSERVPAPEFGNLLRELERNTAATRYDLASLKIEKWRAGWQTAWFKSSSQKLDAIELAVSLNTNLSEAMPGLISQAQGSPASVSATFKLYKDLSAVVECVSILEQMALAFGKKAESSSLHSDYVMLGRIRQDLAAYIQLSADSLEPVDNSPRPGTVSQATVLSAAAQSPRAFTGK